MLIILKLKIVFRQKTFSPRDSFDYWWNKERLMHFKNSHGATIHSDLLSTKKYSAKIQNSFPLGCYTAFINYVNRNSFHNFSLILILRAWMDKCFVFVFLLICLCFPQYFSLYSNQIYLVFLCRYCKHNILQHSSFVLCPDTYFTEV